MSSFSDTVDLERAFLRATTSSIVMARMYLHQASEELFTSDERRFVFAIALTVLNQSNSLLTRKVYEYEVASRLDDSIAVRWIAEWNLIEGVESFDGPEVIIGKLLKAVTGRKALTVSQDVVAMLSKGEIDEAISHMKREAMMIGNVKDDRPLTQLSNIAPRLALIRDKQAHPENYRGIRIGLKTFDDITGGLFPGELTLIAGLTGLGKSTLCRSIAQGIVTLNGAKNVLHIANEEYLEQVEYKYDSVFTGIPYMDFKLARITEEALDRWQRFMQQDMAAAGHGQIFVKEVAAFTDVSLVEQQFRILENRGIKTHAIIIDHLPHIKPIQQAWGENDERAKAATDCKELARWLRVPVIIPTQAATDVEKKTSQNKRAGKLDVYGSKGQIHVANTFLIITYKGTDDSQTDRKDYERDVFLLADIKKNRDGPPFYFLMRHCVRDGKMIEVDSLNEKVSGDETDAASVAIREGESKPDGSGIRDEAMQTLEAIDSNGGDETEEAVTLGSEESKEIEQAIHELGPPIVPMTAKSAARGGQSLLERIRAKKIGVGEYNGSAGTMLNIKVMGERV
jgi:replicative DNA helicase